MSQVHTLPGAVFRVLPEALVASEILDPAWDRLVSREDHEGAKCYTLQPVLSRRECARLIALSESFGFRPAGLAIGDDTYRKADRVRNNLRVIFDAPSLALALWRRVRSRVEARHEGAHVVGLNWRFRVYKYETGHRFHPHYDIRTTLPKGETRHSVVFYLNEQFSGGATRFFEEKDRASRQGQHRTRKCDNREKYALRPAVGGAVVFDHWLLHEGGLVTEGVKYAVRSDVIYRA
jgi:hypothetical protein